MKAGFPRNPAFILFRPGPPIPPYDVNAAFMSSQQHEGGIHAVWARRRRGIRG
jgi:hypothetical protein